MASMSVVRPQQDEFEMRDSLALARNLAWVVRALYGFAVAVAFAAFWAASMASDIDINSKELEEKATSEQLETVTEILRRVEDKIDKQDERQRAIKEGLDRMDERLEAVEEHVDRDENR